MLTAGFVAFSAPVAAQGTAPAPAKPLTAEEIAEFERETSQELAANPRALPASPQAVGGDLPKKPKAPSTPREVDFEADSASYDNIRDIITASGNVMLSDGVQTVRADELEWDRRNQIINASGNILVKREDRSVRGDNAQWNLATKTIQVGGNVRLVDEAGNQLYTQSVELDDAFETGAIEEVLVALRAGGRLAARSGERGQDGTVILNDAAYTACKVEDPDGCGKDPSWRVTADQVTFDPVTNVVDFDGAMLELFGRRILPLPGLAVRTDGRAISGFLVPDLRISESNGVEVSGNYYQRFGDNKDLLLGAHVYTEVAPMVSAEWRHLTGKGAYQITGYATNSSRISTFTGTPETQKAFRGHVFANGRFQFTPEWSFTGSVRLASDRTFLRRYDISRDDRLRSTFNLERIDDDSYFSLAGWATQTLQLGTPQGQVPLALPVIDYRRRIADPVLGGNVELQANTLAIVRKAGQDTQRAFVGAKWDLRKLTNYGQVVTLTALARGDVYHTDSTQLTSTAIYRGNPGWQTRAVALAAVDIEWPLVGEAFGGTQVLKPRIQLVATPPIRNLAVPNEDARAIDLEDSNLFALNRFPGYDRVEDGVRVTYGLDWELLRPGWRIKTTIGQSYRFDKDPAILPDGTGLSERISDFVGRTEVRFRDRVKLTHRYRLDKDNFAIRRNEFDATIGNERDYIELGYLKLDRDITVFEDLQDREELRAAARLSFARYWSVFGSGVVNLTDRDEDPTFASDGFEPIRTRLGVAYEDDCLEFGLTWRRDYVTSGDAERGNTFQLFFSLKNLGFR